MFLRTGARGSGAHPAVRLAFFYPISQSSTALDQLPIISAAIFGGCRSLCVNGWRIVVGTVNIGAMRPSFF
jgi:hypothetical protein